MRISFWPDTNQPWHDILALARHVEKTGWDGIWIADHFMPDDEDLSEPCYEAFTFLSAIAAAVPRIRIGSLVASNTYRHPAVLANIAASLDHVSGGRVVLGVGSGWQENEHRAYGLEFHTVIGRLRRLEEACQVLKALFNEHRANFEGRYYRLVNAPLEPKPVQDPLPLMIGGGGEQVTLRITAHYADEWNVWGDVDTFRHKAAVLDRHCEAIGRDPAEIQRSVAVLVFHSDDPAEVERIRRDPPDHAAIAGNTEQLIETLAAYQAAGLDELIVPDFNLPAGTAKIEALDRFHEEIGRIFQQPDTAPAP